MRLTSRMRWGSRFHTRSRQSQGEFFVIRERNGDSVYPSGDISVLALGLWKNEEPPC